MEQRSRSKSPERKQKVLSDEQYLGIVKQHNSDMSSGRPARPERLYVVVELPEENLYGERATVMYMHYAADGSAKTFWRALLCLITAQRDSELRYQPQTKRLARLIFPNLFSDAICKIQPSGLSRPVPWSEDVQWIEKFLPDAHPWPKFTWNNQFNQLNEQVDGHLYPAPIRLLPEFFD